MRKPETPFEVPYQDRKIHVSVYDEPPEGIVVAVVNLRGVLGELFRNGGMGITTGHIPPEGLDSFRLSPELRARLNKDSIIVNMASRFASVGSTIAIGEEELGREIGVAERIYLLNRGLDSKMKVVMGTKNSYPSIQLLGEGDKVDFSASRTLGLFLHNIPPRHLVRVSGEGFRGIARSVVSGIMLDIIAARNPLASS